MKKYIIIPVVIAMISLRAIAADHEQYHAYLELERLAQVVVKEYRRIENSEEQIIGNTLKSTGLLKGYTERKYQKREHSKIKRKNPASLKFIERFYDELMKAASYLKAGSVFGFDEVMRELYENGVNDANNRTCPTRQDLATRFIVRELKAIKIDPKGDNDSARIARIDLPNSEHYYKKAQWPDQSHSYRVSEPRSITYLKTTNYRPDLPENHESVTLKRDVFDITAPDFQELLSRKALPIFYQELTKPKYMDILLMEENLFPGQWLEAEKFAQCFNIYLSKKLEKMEDDSLHFSVEFKEELSAYHMSFDL